MKILVFLFSLGLVAQPPIWKEIAELETHLQATINQRKAEAIVFGSEPVRGYYIPNQGAFIVIPIRYRLRTYDHVLSEYTDQGIKNASDTVNLEKQVKEWKLTMSKRETIKEAAFEQLVQYIEENLRDVAQFLPSLHATDSITLVVEENEPVYITSFELKKQNQRRVSIIQIDPSRLLELKANTSSPEPAQTIYTTRIANGLTEANKIVGQ